MRVIGQVRRSSESSYLFLVIEVVYYGCTAAFPTPEPEPPLSLCPAKLSEPPPGVWHQHININEGIMFRSVMPLLSPSIPSHFISAFFSVNRHRLLQQSLSYSPFLHPSDHIVHSSTSPFFNFLAIPTFSPCL